MSWKKSGILIAAVSFATTLDWASPGSDATTKPGPIQAPEAARSNDPGSEMIKALPAPGPHPSLESQARLFDRFVGTWDFDCTLWAADGSVTRFPGEWIFGWVLDGRAMQDVWIGHLKSRRPGERGVGTSVRFYDAQAGLWRVVWVAPRSGNVLTLKGGAQGERIVLEGPDRDGSALRWSFNEIQADSFLWRGETSADGGQTWRVEQEMRLRRREAVTVSAGESTGAVPPPGATAPDPGRDMIIALSAPGPHPSLGVEARLFDRLVGTWDCDYSFHAEDGSVSHSNGELRFGWIIDGRALQDIWITYPKRPNGERSIGTSVRFFDIKAKMWRVVWVAPAFGQLNTLQGEAERDRIALKGEDGDGSSLRWSFNQIQAHSFIWRGERSRDGGKTWRLEEEHQMKRRTGP